MKKLKLRNISLLLSALSVIVSIVIVATWGLKVGIDFTGGQIIEVNFQQELEIGQLRATLKAGNDNNTLPNITVSSSEDNFLLRSPVLTEEQLVNLKQALTEIGEWQQVRLETVGPTISKDLTKKALLGVLWASLAIVLYIAWSFRKVPKPANSWQFGLTAIIALLHDLTIMVGSFALFGKFFGFEVDALFVTALLTIMGYSVHDTIIVYDRIRENLLLEPKEPFESSVDVSVKQTIARSLNTSLTLILVLICLLVLGGTTLRPFISALLVGAVIGTYSSIFVAAQLLIVWQELATTRQKIVTKGD